MHVAEPPHFDTLIRNLDNERLLKIIRSIPRDGKEYIHWDKLRHLTPPDGLTSEEWWFGIKWSRVPLLRPLPLLDLNGDPFAYSTPDLVLRLLHHVDQRCSGEIAMPEVVTADDQARQHYLVNSLMEEAIRSSQLEGATTSRRVAKDLLRTGRDPEDRSERMILNNYRALLFMREMGSTLTPATICELQRILTEGTMADPTAAGRLQRPGEERVAVLDRSDPTKVLHKPPPAEELPGRLQTLCDFANEAPDSERFVHPVVRAILLHFWLAYDHPFEDGNGRTARALFYWYMRERGYWLIEYLSISRILADAPSQYTKSFLFAETDDRDTTYFIVFQLEVIERAIGELHAYLDRKVKEVRVVERLLQADSSEFNHRQLVLLSHAIRTPGHTYTFQSHALSHSVTTETARNDLLPLAKSGLLRRRKAGRKHVFSAHPRLADRLRESH